jgi:gluconate kinase
MSFLDSLENNLKALESREDGGVASTKSRDQERSKAKAEAPWAERLRNDPWTQKLMQDVTRAGFQRRTKVNLVWMGSTLRMEARRLRLELRPEVDGITAVYLNGQEEAKRERVDLKQDPGGLIARWMSSVDIQKKLDEEEAARAAAAFEDDEEK